MIMSDTSYFEKNMASLKENHPDTFATVSKDQKCLNKIELVLSENQKKNIRVKTEENEYRLIHNNKDPGLESEKFLSMVKEDSTGVVLMLGMGLGYGALELIEKRKKLHYLIIFELNVEFFLLALRHIDLTPLFSDTRVILCLGEPDSLESIMAPANRALMLEDIHTLNLQQCFRVNPAYENLASLVFDYINAFNTEGATKIAHGFTFFENRLKHLTSIHHDRKLEDLSGKFQGVPAIIVAAGPSLDKNINQIEEAMGRAVIISVDTALPNLLNHGIKPDFLTSIDYNELTNEKISGMASNPECKQINLICTSWVADTVTKQFPSKNIFWAFAGNALENWINVSLGGKMAISGAGTVAHLNFISASIMGCNPIVFVGQDLAFPDNKGHSSNVVLNSDEKIQKTIGSGQDTMWIDGFYDSKVQTNRQMLSYKATFEELIKKSDRKVINSTEGGASIAGTQQMPLSRAIDEYCSDKVILTFDYEHEQETLLLSMKETIKRIIKLEKEIKKTDRLAGGIQKELRKLKNGSRKFRTYSELPVKLQKKVLELEKSNNKADSNPIWPLFDEMTLEDLRRNEREKKEIEKIEGNPEKYIKWLSGSVDRINTVNRIRMRNLEWFQKQLKELVVYHGDEQSKLKQIKKDPKNSKFILEIAELYLRSGNLVLMERILDKYIDSKAESIPMVDYYRGIIALYHGDHKAAENKFQTVMDHDESCIEKIDKVRNEIADNYLRLASLQSTLTDFGYSVVEMLLLKGLKCCPNHPGIKKQLGQFAEDALVKVEQRFKEKTGNLSESCGKTLERWIKLIANEMVIIHCLKQETICSFYLLYGKMLVDENKYQDALNHYQEALSIIPEVPDFYIALADIYFANEEFDSGLQFLSKAVSLDKQYAAYWYNMGKNLQSQNDYNGAILAYEQYFIALPEKIGVLKEIGDCYIKLGDLDAAQEAYQQLKKLNSEN